MRKSVLAVAITGVLSLPTLVQAEEPASPHTITGNMAIVSDYRFRGITQTFEKPAIQGGIDYSHSSGIYLGNWNSNVSEGAGFPEANLEMDFYGGWKYASGDWGLDVGAIYYYYPGSDFNLARTGALTNPKTGNAHTGEVSNTEVYIGGSWKFISLKYYYAVSDYFSSPDTDGTNYLDLSASYDLGNGWGINGHVGRLSVDNYHAGTDISDADYTDYKLGVTKALGSWTVAASYIGTNAKGDCNPANPGFYCFVKAAGSTSTKDAGDDTVVVSLSKSF
jgi:uncharacterized protein (TIGR02001 family)